MRFMGSEELPPSQDDAREFVRLMMEKLNERKVDSAKENHNVLGKAREQIENAKTIAGAFWILAVMLVLSTIWVWNIKTNGDDNKERILVLRKDLSDASARITQLEKDLLKKIDRKPDYYDSK